MDDSLPVSSVQGSLQARILEWAVHGSLQAKILEWAAISFSRDLPTQESNIGLQHCRQILCQLSYMGSPFQSQRSAMPKNVQTIAQLHSFHMLAK